jgi:leader peptidase (prepilin peptidase) / N-methyltransferase
MTDAEIWRQVPFPFWTAVSFVFGCMVGSFLNVCIHRMPRGESIVRPRSHCPHCRYSIPAYLNIPLLTWLWLGGQCANCKAPISPRYFFVELLTGVGFAACWIKFGHFNPLLAPVYWLLLGGLIVATFIDFEHFIIPDEITIGGMVAGFVCSFLVPALHMNFPNFKRLGSSGTWLASCGPSMAQSVWGIVVGSGVVYAILRAGKLFFGRQKMELPPASTIFFTETAICLPDAEIPYEEVFYRPTDAIELEAKTVELIDRCYRNVRVRLEPQRLQIGSDTFNPEEVPHLEAVADQIVLPREAMGLGDVKFMGAIGAFLGWPAVFYCLAVSSVIGAVVGLTLILSGRREWSSRLPYGPYIAVAAVLWIFGGYDWVRRLLF